MTPAIAFLLLFLQFRLSASFTDEHSIRFPFPWASTIDWEDEDWLECVEDNPEALLHWDALPSARRNVLAYRGWTAERWNTEDKCRMPMRRSTPDAFNVQVLSGVSVPLDLTSATLCNMTDTSIRLVKGGSEKNEDFVDEKTLDSIMHGIQQGDTSFYLHLEEGMHEKDGDLAVIGEQIVSNLLPVVREHSEMHRVGLWNATWNAIDVDFDGDDSFDWALFAGAKGTKSHLHYDDDLFNFLYLIEGRKRIIIIPNDERTEESFGRHQNEDGGTGWGELDVFNPNTTLPEHTVELILEAGQAIAIPYVSWHAVENLENTLAVSLRLVDW